MPPTLPEFCRYHVFGGPQDYPSGGAHDALAEFHTEGAAMQYAQACADSGSVDWVHVWDLTTGDVLRIKDFPTHGLGSLPCRST